MCVNLHSLHEQIHPPFCSTHELWCPRRRCHVVERTRTGRIHGLEKGESKANVIDKKRQILRFKPRSNDRIVQ